MMKLQKMKRSLKKRKIIKSGSKTIGVEEEEREVEEVVENKETEIKMMIKNVQKAPMLKSKEPGVDKFIKDVEEVTKEITIEVMTINKSNTDQKVKNLRKKMANRKKNMLMTNPNKTNLPITNPKTMCHQQKETPKNRKTKTITLTNVAAEVEEEVDVVDMTSHTIRRTTERTETTEITTKRGNTNQKTKIKITNPR